MKKIFLFYIIFLFIFLSAIFLFNERLIDDIYSLITLLLMFFLLVSMFYQYEKGDLSSKEISLIAIISGVSAVSRVPFAAIPSVQPCTFLIICTGYVYGPIPGFMVGSITALVSNIFLGHGPWTLFQMFAWGLIGSTASILKRLKFEKFGLIIYGAISGFIFGWIMNLWYWLLYIYPHTVYTFGFSMLGSLWMDTLHSIGNVIFLIFLGEKTIKIFNRYKKRFHIEFITKNKTLSLKEPVVKPQDS